jgi:hypothetical protein
VRAHAAGLACAAVALLLVAAVDGRTTRDRPPPGHTGGFGEPTCHACHFMAEVNSGGGALAIAGLPRAWEPGRLYTVEVTLNHDGMRAAGFQLAARFEDGTQAGRLSAIDGEASGVEVAKQDGVAYALQLYAGSRPDADGRIRWTVAWTAPDAGGTVHFHAAANAADADESPLGDYVYTAVARAAAP